MAGEFERDREMDGLLKRTLRGGGKGDGPCLEPEQFAAWIDGGLSDDEARAVEVHLSNCARCQAMAAAFDASEATPAAAPAVVIPIAVKRPIRWILPAAAVGTIAASLLLWVGTRDQREPELVMTSASRENQERAVSPPAPAASPVTQDTGRSDDRSQAKQLSARAQQGQQGGGATRDLARREARTTDPKVAAAEPPARPAELASAAKSDLQRRAAPAPVAAPPPPKPAVTLAMPPPPPPPTVPTAPRSSTVSGLPQSSINVTLDGVSTAAAGRASETFFTIPTVIAEFASPSSTSARLDALETVVLTQSAVSSGARGGGRGGAGQGQTAFRSAIPENRGAIEGTVRDASGGIVPGVTIVARDLGTAATSTAITDNTGTFRFSSLAPGRYSVTANLAGFVQKIVDNVVVESGRASQVSLPLAVGALSESVTVNRASGLGGGGGRGVAAVSDTLAKSAEPAASSVTRWRIHSDNRVERSRDAGLNWQRALIEVGLPTITTGVAPSGNVCWLIGRSGLVLVTSDGLNFKRAAQPANVDLLFVQATDARNATVTTSDGRKFSTNDGGLTWK